ncbi:PssD/Cps14F family polysaccharide biosynthesis glycosyltransferase [uncultured Senegalimassilia sp.]|uniref:PssD/Cps14F family polysaccharide biosynthesis glycosyltransferase n=1 Tax=uncultured Senegalimassilia sp. TaxID=1714350 RepID=UPI0027DE54D4|nr:PssD/Cps14F family polysaccharide biosynthesis glycosyltransferase [uncultured Senegalimassilia sp.]
MARNPKDIKVCFAASSGGHLEQLLALKPLMERYDSFILTEKTAYEAKLPVRARYVRQVNRHEAAFVPNMLANTATSLKYWLAERPDVVVCTGVLATIPFCLIAHAMGAKLVYIESFAKTGSPTMTGRLLSKKADRLYVQWESMLKVYPDARFVGGVY